MPSDTCIPFFFAPAKQRNKSDLENLDKNVDIYIV